MRALYRLALLDLAILGLWWDQGVAGLPLLGVLHLGTTLAAAVIVWRDGKEAAGGMDRYHWTPWNWNGLALPLGAVLGVPGIVVLMRTRPWSPGRASRRALAPPRRGSQRLELTDDQDEVARFLDGRVCIPAAGNVEALCSVLRHGTLERRCAALQAVVRSFEPRLTPLVAIALADPDQTVRALAAATSAQVGANLAERIAQMEAEPAPRLEELYDFAMLLFDHGSSNVLLSRSQASHLLGNARVRLAAVLNDPQLPAPMRDAATAAMGELAARRTNRADGPLVHLAQGTVAA
ncbi:MAG: hypothetical protein RIS94_943 [Pseudomonadota bacterium]|jgi:hypothetical protein